MSLGIKARNWGQRIFSSLGFQRGRLPRVPFAVILGYHSVQGRPEHYADTIGQGIIHSAQAFAMQMELIAREYSPVSLDEIPRYLRGELAPPRNAVAVTFDDGYRDNAEIAAPLLARYGIPAAFYLTTSLINTSEVPWFCRMRYAFASTKQRMWVEPVRGQKWKLTGRPARKRALQVAFEIGSAMIGNERQELLSAIDRALDVAPFDRAANFMLTWDQARALRDAGHIIGSHSHTHPNLAHLRDEGLILAEFLESKRHIKENLCAAAPHFSYPHPALHPQYDLRTMSLSKEAGYQTALTTTHGGVLPRENPLLLSRMMAPKGVEELRRDLKRAFGSCGLRSRLLPSN